MYLQRRLPRPNWSANLFAEGAMKAASAHFTRTWHPGANRVALHLVINALLLVLVSCGRRDVLRTHYSPCTGFGRYRELELTTS